MPAFAGEARSCTKGARAGNSGCRARLFDFTFHDLRHSFVSLMAAAGVHVSVIAAMVGHRDGGALLLRRYRHLFPHEQKAAAAAFERLVVRGGVAQGLQAASRSQRDS